MESVERHVTLPADIAEVWALLTSPDHLAAWLGDEVVLEPTPGTMGRVVERDGTERSLVVDEVQEGHRLAWRWWVEAGTDARDVSRVELTLSPTTDGTIVRVVEHRLPHATASVAQARAGEAWSHRLLHLEALLLVAAAVRG
jgi:uncharacterized protein YndB with AHSA1/START domain